MSAARPDQSTRANVFRALHQRDHAFITPNPWDPGTARILSHLGFEALATTSAGYAFSVGRSDNELARDETLAHFRALTEATDLPVSADLGNGFGDDPETVASTIQLCAATGVVGGSIEDATLRPESPIYPHGAAVERIQAAKEAARALPFPFTLTARCENFLWERPNIADTIKRLQAYQEAGADVLYAPGLPTREDIIAVVRSVDRPVNVVMGLKGVRLSVAELNEIGVRRVSVGSALSRVTLGAFVRAAREMKELGTFSFADQALGMADLQRMLANPPGASRAGWARSPDRVDL
jgi:2-methylisocitrate lyase-like PEP mutase family enzyme